MFLRCVFEKEKKFERKCLMRLVPVWTLSVFWKAVLLFVCRAVPVPNESWLKQSCNFFLVFKVGKEVFPTLSEKAEDSVGLGSEQGSG